MGRKKKSGQTASGNQSTLKPETTSQQSAPVDTTPSTIMPPLQNEQHDQNSDEVYQELQTPHVAHDGNSAPTQSAQGNRGHGKGNSSSASCSLGNWNGPGAVPRGRGRAHGRGISTKHETSPSCLPPEQQISPDLGENDFPALGASKRRDNVRTGQVIQQIVKLQMQDEASSLPVPDMQGHAAAVTSHLESPYQMDQVVPAYQQVILPQQVIYQTHQVQNDMQQQQLIPPPQQQVYPAQLTPPFTPQQQQHLQYQIVHAPYQVLTSTPSQNQVPLVPLTLAPPQQTNPPPQLATAQPPVQKQLVSQASIAEVPSNFRHGGTKGVKIQLQANHFQLRLSPNIQRAFQYDVTIEPDKPKKLLPGVMQQLQRKYYPNNHPAYDGMKNLFSAKELPLQLPFEGDVKIMDDERESEYTVRVQLATIVDLTALTRFFNQKCQNHIVPPMHVLQCLDIVLRSRPSITMITAGRSYFSVPDEIVKLGNGMEMYRGFYQSAILGWKPFLNVDVSHKAFPSPMPVLDLIREFDQYADFNANLQRYVEVKLARHMYNIKVEYKLPNNLASKRTYRCHGLEKSANNFIFTNDKGEEVSVAEYFKKEKKYSIKYAHLPCLWVGNKQRRPKVVLPLELCIVIGDQVTNHRMDETQTRNMIRSATTSTTVRKDHIKRSMQLANHNASPVMKEFGLSVDSEMTEVTGRILSPPVIKYQNGSQTVVKGVWKNSHFITPASISKWAILCLDNRVPDKKLTELKDHVLRQGSLWNMNVTQNVTIARINVDKISNDSIINSIYHQFSQFRADKMQLVYVVLNDRLADCYGIVKRIAELQIGCLTQCIRNLTMSRLTLKTIDNILLKANVKLNGVNHVWRDRPMVMNRPAIIMGADVTHPGPESSEHSPSVAAVTASQDPQAAVYNILWRLQDPRTEIIADLESMARKQLMTFYEKTRHKPERIIFYRDGVSDGQFEQVRKMEIQAVRNACTSLSQTYKPAITFLVVQKRHHTRFFPSDAKDAADKNGNVPAGTCVDTVITHPIRQDFYLVSHASIQGVAKPTKYRTLWDDSNLPDDVIEQLTFYLCHMFARCNRAVSYPAPTFYAHLAAARAKVYIDENKHDLTDLNKLHEQIKIACEIQDNHPMFFV